MLVLLAAAGAVLGEVDRHPARVDELDALRVVDARPGGEVAAALLLVGVGHDVGPCQGQPGLGHHPRARGPEEEPAAAGQHGWAATSVRQRDLQEAQRRGALHQQAQGPPGGGHPLRLRLHIPRNHRPRLDQDLAPRPRPMIRGAGASGVRRRHSSPRARGSRLRAGSAAPHCRAGTCRRGCGDGARRR